MKRFIYTLITAISLSSFSPVSWADVAHEAAQIEQVELEIIRLKRERMDLERAYRFERNGSDVKDVPELTRQYTLTSLQISEELSRQEKIKMRLVEKSINGYLAADRD